MTNSPRAVAAFVILASLLISSTIYGQGTVFTYQSRLNSGGTPANGSFDFVFAAYDSGVAGTRMAGPVTNTGVSVVSGLFTAGIDFGTNVFTGGQRWLEIAVRTNGSDSFTTLLPRQPLTAAPYAIYAGTVSAIGYASTIPPASIGAGTVTSNMLAPGVAAANLAAAGATILSVDLKCHESQCGGIYAVGRAG